MTDRELMQMALNAIEEFCEYQAMLQPTEIRNALRARLAWMHTSETGTATSLMMKVGTGLSTAPPQRKEWQGLTDEEYKAIRYGHDENGEPNVEYELFDEGEYGMEVNIYVDDFYRAIEAKLKEKNNA